jgi:hypothetical protein
VLGVMDSQFLRDKIADYCYELEHFDNDIRFKDLSDRYKEKYYGYADAVLKIVYSSFVEEKSQGLADEILEIVKLSLRSICGVDVDQSGKMYKEKGLYPLQGMCSSCGREEYSKEKVGGHCGMNQPNGKKCYGIIKEAIK